QSLPATGLWPQRIRNGIVVWALVNGLITATLLLAAQYLVLRRRGVAGSHFGIAASPKHVGASVVLALTIVASLYALAALVDGLFSLDFRFWVVALKLMSKQQLLSFL